MNARHDHKTGAHGETIEGEFQYPIYSPKGGIEGALLHAGDEPVQLVFEPHGGRGAEAFAGLKAGERVVVEVSATPASDKGEAQHAVYRFERLVSVNGGHAAKPAGGAKAPFSGIVVRLNFARHGEANGVVLDSGHFIHTRPGGMARLKLGIGDRVQADGEARPLVNGTGQVVEATVVNGKPMTQPKPPKQ